LSAKHRLWQPDGVSLRAALAQALYRAPGTLRRSVPRVVRDAVRGRVGPFAPWEVGYAHTPPPPGPGEVVGPPDFVGIGAQKAGTTWWFTLIVAHPDVVQRNDVHKERHYFAPYATEAFGPARIRRYHEWFARPPGTITGEWTPDYVYQPWVAPLLERAAPEARLLMIVRDPVERMVSGLVHSRLVPASHLGTAVAEAVNRGFYAAALRPWTAALEAHRVLVLQYERCVADPAGQLARTYRFLGLDDGFHPDDMRRASSPTRQAKAPLDADARARLVELFRPDVAELGRLVPDLDLDLWPNFASG